MHAEGHDEAQQILAPDAQDFSMLAPRRCDVKKEHEQAYGSWAQPCCNAPPPVLTATQCGTDVANQSASRYASAGHRRPPQMVLPGLLPALLPMAAPPFQEGWQAG